MLMPDENVNPSTSPNPSQSEIVNPTSVPHRKRFNKWFFVIIAFVLLVGLVILFFLYRQPQNNLKAEKLATSSKEGTISASPKNIVTTASPQEPHEDTVVFTRINGLKEEILSELKITNFNQVFTYTFNEGDFYYQQADEILKYSLETKRTDKVYKLKPEFVNMNFRNKIEFVKPNSLVLYLNSGSTQENVTGKITLVEYDLASKKEREIGKIETPNVNSGYEYIHYISKTNAGDVVVDEGLFDETKVYLFNNGVKKVVEITQKANTTKPFKGFIGAITNTNKVIFATTKSTFDNSNSQFQDRVYSKDLLTGSEEEIVNLSEYVFSPFSDRTYLVNIQNKETGKLVLLTKDRDKLVIFNPNTKKVENTIAVQKDELFSLNWVSSTKLVTYLKEDGDCPCHPNRIVDINSGRISSKIVFLGGNPYPYSEGSPGFVGTFNGFPVRLLIKG